MSIVDLLSALPGALAFGLLPGLALATVIVPRRPWWQRLAAAPGLSAGWTGITGLALHDLHIPFGLLSMGVIDAALTGVAARRALRTRPPVRDAARLPRARRRVQGVVVAVALAAGACSVGAVGVAMRDVPLPPNTDAPVHAEVAHAIVTQRDVLPVLPEPADNTTWSRPRTGYEAVVALTTAAGGPDVGHALLPVACLAVLLLPLGVASLALVATRRHTVAATAAALCVGAAIPLIPTELGEFTTLVDATMIPLLVISLHAWVRSSRAQPAELMAAAACLASMWAVHGLEAATAALVGGPLIAAVAWRHRRWAARRLLLAGAGLAAAAALVTVLTRVPVAPSSGNPAVYSEAAAFTATMGGSTLGQAVDMIHGLVFANAAVLVLLPVGLLVCVRRARLRWLAATQLLVVLLTLDVMSIGGGAAVLGRLYPWSQPERLLGVWLWVTPIVAAVGLVAAVDALRALMARRRSVAPRGTRSIAAIATAACAITGAFLGIRHDVWFYTAVDSTKDVVTAADIRMFQVTDSRLPRGALVLTDGVEDSGMWLGALSDATEVLPKGYLQTHPDDRRLVALAAACTDPGGAEAALGGVDAVFVGDVARDDAKHRWSLPCIEQLRGIRVIATATSGPGTAALLAVDRGVSAVR